MRATSAEAFSNGLATVSTDVRAGTQLFRFRDKTFELPTGSVRIAQWNGLLVALFIDVEDMAIHLGLHVADDQWHSAW